MYKDPHSQKEYESVEEYIEDCLNRPAINQPYVSTNLKEEYRKYLIKKYV